MYACGVAAGPESWFCKSEGRKAGAYTNVLVQSSIIGIMQECTYGLDTEVCIQVWHALCTAQAFDCTMFTFVMVLYQGALYQASNPSSPHVNKISITVKSPNSNSNKEEGPFPSGRSK